MSTKSKSDHHLHGCYDSFANKTPITPNETYILCVIQNISSAISPHKHDQKPKISLVNDPRGTPVVLITLACILTFLIGFIMGTFLMKFWCNRESKVSFADSPQHWRLKTVQLPR